MKGKTGQEIHCELTNVYGSSAPSYAQVKFVVGEFKRSRTSLEDETRSGCPSDATDEEMCNEVRDLVYSELRWKKIENALHISHGLFVLRFYGPVNPMGSCRARSVYLTTRLLGRLSPLSG